MILLKLYLIKLKKNTKKKKNPEKLKKYERHSKEEVFAVVCAKQDIVILRLFTPRKYTM
jgi:hypothetical protein